MLNGYNKRFTGKDRRMYLCIHPSSRQLSRITKHTEIIIWNIFGMIAGNAIAALISGNLPVLGILFFPILIFLLIRIATSYRVLGDTYNSYLLPVEQAYNRMCKEDRLRYKRYLEDAYRNCSKDVEFNRQANRDVLDLFRLTIGDSEEDGPEKSELQFELEAVRAKIAAEKEKKKLMADALHAEKEILKEIEGRLNGH